MTNNEHADALAEFRAQLIERLKKRKEIRKLNSEQFNQLVTELDELRCMVPRSGEKSSEKNQCGHTRSNRAKALKDVNTAAHKLVQTISKLHDLDAQILDDKYQHTINLASRISIINEIIQDTDSAAPHLSGKGKQPDTTLMIFRALEGGALCRILDKYGISLTTQNYFHSKGTNLIPDADSPATTAMICAMLSLLHSNIERLDWSQAVELIESGKNYNQQLARLARVESPKLNQSLKEFLTGLPEK